MAAGKTRPRRADAQRNYNSLVEQARIAFTENGGDASLDEIARRVGVASGTLYRHFPTRLDLIEAVLSEEIAELVALGRRLLLADDELDALFSWLRAATAHGLTYQGLAGVVMNSALDDEDNPASVWHAEMFEVSSGLLLRAQKTGRVSADTDPADVLKLLSAIAWAVQNAPDGAAQAERLLVLMMNGLR